MECTGVSKVKAIWYEDFRPTQQEKRNNSLASRFMHSKKAREITKWKFSVEMKKEKS
jgi:hypothetical protein